MKKKYEILLENDAAALDKVQLVKRTLNFLIELHLCLIKRLKL